MMPNRYPSIGLLLTWCVLMFPRVVHGDESPANLPAGFRLIGHYELHSKIRVEAGHSMSVVISPLRYRVYSDGIDVRVYCHTNGEANYTRYAIYRSDGVGVVQESGEINLIAGVQGYSTKAEMIRQISVTRNSLTMVKMPPRTHRVLITHAKAVALPSVQPPVPHRK
ncbi:MAG: hypothetical protein KJO21_08050 [Verrucomicrobiae bacterium]|nr:hypothetical protein [Verrucomicrobiae bacterium]NNJ43426.1 hypothetical protein [Akkermansiaceae bacterium]